jgi:hypothetical protein
MNVRSGLLGAFHAVVVMAATSLAVPCLAQVDAPTEAAFADPQPAAPAVQLQPSPAPTPFGVALPSGLPSSDVAVLDAPAGDGRRTISAFPANLARGVVGVFSRDNLQPFLLGAGLAAGGHSLDRRVQVLLDDRCLQCGRTGATMGGVAVVPFVGALFVAGRLSPQGPFRDTTYDFAQALAVDMVWTSALKYSLHRQRPNHGDFLSLPSGHTSAAFSLATVASRHYGWKLGVPAYLLASGIGLSRIESNKHYFSDVLAGAVLGVIVGRTVTRVDGEPAAKHRRISIGPATDVHGAGVGVNVSTSW